jgi:leader peptidase (prepilin peptidase)/N-methyltransferase
MFSGFFGACVGSFLNVVIWRLPQEKSIIRPGSHCPKCGNPIRWFDNIPLLSYVLLNGKCRKCKTPISLRYPFVEFLTAIVFVLIYAIDMMGAWKLSPGNDVVALLVHWTFVAVVIAVTFIDFDLQIIPDELSLGGAGLGMVLAGVFPGKFATMLPFAQSWTGISEILGGLLSALAGGLTGAGITWLAGWLGSKAFKKEAMGFGDVKLMLFFGCLFGFKAAIIIFFTAPFFGLLVAVPHKLLTKDSYIAYGPFLSMSAIGYMFFGKYFDKFMQSLANGGL